MQIGLRNREYFYQNSDRSLIEDKFKSEIMNGGYIRIISEQYKLNAILLLHLKQINFSLNFHV